LKLRARGLTVLVGTTALAAAALTAPAIAGANPTNGETNPYSPANGHSYRHGVMPTKSVQNKMNAWAKTHAAAAATGTQTLSYGGGVDGIGVQSGHSKVYLVFYGNQWGTSSTDANGNLKFSGDANGAAGAAQQMFKGIGTNSELWSAELTQWCDGAGVAAGATSCPSGATHIPYQSGGVLSGVWYDNGAASPSSATGHQLGVEAVNAAAHFGNTTAASNRYAYYVVLSPHGTNPDNYQSPTQGYCAWHDYNGDTTLTGGAVASSYGDIAFSNQPYNIDMGASCGVGFVNSPGTLDGWTMTLGHEWHEMMSDQNPAGGWTNHTGSSYNGQENSDECAWLSPGTNGGAANVSFGSFGTYAEQASWSNDTNSCAISHAIVGGGTTGNTVTVNNPGSKTGTVGTATSLQMTGTDSGGLALTYSATGLPTGLSISSSGLISGTPSTAGTYSVTVTAKDSTNASGSASFTWTISTSGGGCASPGQKLLNPGFESGATNWSQTSGVINTDGAHSRTGVGYSWLDGYGTTHTDTISQSVTIPAGCSAVLTYYLSVSTAETTTTSAYDTLSVSVNGTKVGSTYSNLNAGGYAQRQVTLSSYAGQTVTIKWTGTEDVSLATSFFVDDTALTVS
jgi:serine protease